MWKHFAMQFFSNMSYGCSQHLKKDNSHLFWIKVDCLQEFGIYESSWCISAWQWCLREQMIGLGDRRMIIIYIYIYSPQQCAVEKGFIPRAISSHQVDRWEFLSQWHLHLFTFYVVLLPVCWAEEEFTMNIYSLLKGDILWSAESPNKVGEGGTKMPAHVTRHHVATRAAFVSRLLARLTLTQRAVTE